MKVERLLLLPALCLTAATAFCQQAPSTLTYRVENATRYNTDSSRVNATYRVRLLEKLPDNRLRVEVTLLDYVQSGAVSPFNSSTILTEPVNSTSSVYIALLLQQPLEVVLDPADRRRLPQPAIAAFVEKRAREMMVREDIIKMIQDYTPDFGRDELRSIFFPVPAAVTSWQSRDSIVLYKVRSTSRGTRTITGTLNPARKKAGENGSLAEAYTQDGASGKLLKAVLAYSSTITYPDNGITRTMHTTVNTTIVPAEGTYQPAAVIPEQVELAIKAGPYSHALKTAQGSAMDSAKLAALLQKCDPVLAGDKSYIHMKLSLIQQADRRGRFEAYDEALRTTPNYLLEGHSSHIHNKLQTVLSENTDSAMQLIGYLAAADASSLQGWLQHSFAQYLFNAPAGKQLEAAQKAWKERGAGEAEIAKLTEGARERSKRASTVIARMATGGSATTVTNATQPMYLYHLAAKQNNPDSIRSIVRRFRALSPAAQKTGNAGRYGLMLYKHMKAEGMQADAAAILASTVSFLEKSTADTLNKDRHTSQNMLAHAYFLQYEAAKEANDGKAIGYLAKASAVSPRSPKENTHDSFYDRALLRSSESYRGEYLRTLVKTGDKQDIPRVLAEQINADPSIMPQAQQTFEEHFPGRSFKDFVANTVTMSWADAPDFELKGPDGTPYKLSDFRGKWLLIDFWGTWCPPCRAELPQIEALAKKVKTSTSQAFFSIACRDTPQDVTALFATAGYTFPVGMSDGNVQQAYKVTGYPSKYIVSPNGKLLPIGHFGEWAKKLELFGNLKDRSAKEMEQKAAIPPQLN